MQMPLVPHPHVKINLLSGKQGTNSAAHRVNKSHLENKRRKFSGTESFREGGTDKASYMCLAGVQSKQYREVLESSYRRTR